MKIRITGLPGQVDTAAARIASVLTVLETSPMTSIRDRDRACAGVF